MSEKPEDKNPKVKDENERVEKPRKKASVWTEQNQSKGDDYLVIALCLIGIFIFGGWIADSLENIFGAEQKTPTIASGSMTAAPQTFTHTPTVRPTAVPTQVLLASQETLERDLVWMVNRLRVEKGLNQLVWDEELTSIARIRAEDMARQNYFGHNPPDGCNFKCLADRHRISYSWLGENIAWNSHSFQKTLAVAMEMLIASPPHYKQLTDCHFERIGIGAVQKGEKYFYTQIFEGARSC
jgi:uncharacterized protein YkwD